MKSPCWAPGWSAWPPPVTSAHGARVVSSSAAPGRGGSALGDGNLSARRRLRLGVARRAEHGGDALALRPRHQATAPPRPAPVGLVLQFLAQCADRRPPAQRAG